eukprot:1528770-Rhodomonas_salina.1
MRQPGWRGHGERKLRLHVLRVTSLTGRLQPDSEYRGCGTAELSLAVTRRPATGTGRLRVRPGPESDAAPRDSARDHDAFESLSWSLARSLAGHWPGHGHGPSQLMASEVELSRYSENMPAMPLAVRRGHVAVSLRSLRLGDNAIRCKNKHKKPHSCALAAESLREEGGLRLQLGDALRSVTCHASDADSDPDDSSEESEAAQ